MLSNPVPRKQIHTREVVFNCFEREDSLWDIEARILDTKPFKLELSHRTWEPNEPIHDMTIRLTVNQALVVQAIETSMDSHPHGACPEAIEGMKKMIGCRLGYGWRKAINENLGRVQGCTHLRELLFNMATAAFQSVPGGLSGDDEEQPPHHLGTCKAWDFNGETVLKFYPKFYGWSPKK